MKTRTRGKERARVRARARKKKKQLRRAISIVLVRVFKHEISNFICWKITGKNATVTGVIATSTAADVKPPA